MLTPGSGQARPHWLDRLALNMAARADHRPAGAPADAAVSGRNWRAQSTGVLNRRGLLKASAAAAVATLGPQAGRPALAAPQSGVKCVDEKFKICSESALQYLKPPDEVNKTAAQSALFLGLGMVGFTSLMALCESEAANRHCKPCETCDSGANLCTSTCSANSSCRDGNCVCDPCFEDDRNLIVPWFQNCVPVICPHGKECNPANGECEATCGGQTCSPSHPDCCSDECVNLLNDPHNCGACGHACAAGEKCIDGNCGGPIWCPCNKTCYPTSQECLNDCEVNLGCTVGYCSPQTTCPPPGS